MSVCEVPNCDRPVKALGMCGAHNERRRNGKPLDPPIARGSVDFETLVEKGAGCWKWTGAVSGNGYGRYSTSYAHRLMYERHVGPIPTGMHIDHLCRTRLCCNPAHLEVVTQKVNTQRGMAPSAIATRTNYCQRGHEFTPENTHMRPSGKRMCMACNRFRWHTRGKALRALRTAS